MVRERAIERKFDFVKKAMEEKERKKGALAERDPTVGFNEKEEKERQMSGPELL